MSDITTLNFLSYSLWKHDIYGGKGSEGGGNPERIVHHLYLWDFRFNLLSALAHQESGPRLWLSVTA